MSYAVYNTFIDEAIYVILPKYREVRVDSKHMDCCGIDHIVRNRGTLTITRVRLVFFLFFFFFFFVFSKKRVRLG